MNVHSKVMTPKLEANMCGMMVDIYKTSDLELLPVSGRISVHNFDGGGVNTLMTQLSCAVDVEVLSK